MKTTSKWVFLALSALFVLPVAAFAQYTQSNPPFLQYEISQRLWPYTLAVIIGLALGAFYSEKAKPFRGLLMLINTIMLGLLNIWLGCIVLFCAGFALARKLLKIPRQEESMTTFGSAQ